jgi:hypothetical protein
VTDYRDIIDCGSLGDDVAMQLQRGSGVDMQMQGLAIVVRVSKAKDICGLSMVV